MLWIFFLWVNIIKIKKIKRILESGRSIIIDVILLEKKTSLARLIMNTVKVEKIDETDEYLNIKETTIHVNMNIIESWIDKAEIIPRYVATPFPPLNFNHTGNTWPKNVNRHDNWTHSL